MSWRYNFCDILQRSKGLIKLVLDLETEICYHAAMKYIYHGEHAT